MPKSHLISSLFFCYFLPSLSLHFIRSSTYSTTTIVIYFIRFEFEYVETNKIRELIAYVILLVQF